MPGFARVEAQMHRPPAVAFQQLFSTDFPYATNAIDLWDDSITVPTGTNRLLLVALGATSPGADDCRIDPAGLNIQLTELTGSPQAFSSTDENAIGFVLKEADFGALSGSKVLRYDPAGSRRGGKRVLGYQGANQTVHSAGNSIDGGMLTVNLTRPTSVFPVGSLVKAWCYAEATGGYTVGGDVALEAETDIATDTDHWVYAIGTIATAKSTVSATFTRIAGGVTRKQAIILVVEPA